MNKEYVIKAVYEEDLIEYLKSVGLYEKVINSEIDCFACGKKLELGNLGAIIPKEGKLYICCDKEDCLKVLDEIQ